MNNDIDQMHFLVLHIGEACCRENWNYKNICSPFTRIYYVTKGYAQIELPDKKQDLHPGLMYIIPVSYTHLDVYKRQAIHTPNVLQEHDAHGKQCSKNSQRPQQQPGIEET